MPLESIAGFFQSLEAILMFCWGLGWIMCRVVTLGQWPKAGFWSPSDAKKSVFGKVAFIGFMGYVILFCLLYFVVD